MSVSVECGRSKAVELLRLKRQKSKLNLTKASEQNRPIVYAFFHSSTYILPNFREQDT